MSVFKRAGSPYFHYRFMLNGRRYTGSTEQKNPHKAKQVESDKMTALLRGEMPISGKSPRLSAFAELFKTYVREACEAKHLSVKTRRYYENGCRLLEATRVWTLRLHQITSEDAATMKFPHSPSNANNALRTLRRILGYAKERNLIRIVPEIALLEENERQAVVEPWVEDLFLEAAKSPLREIIIIALDSFLRPNEACRIRWEDVRWNDAQIYVPTGKTRRARRFVVMTDRMERELRIRQAAAETAKQARIRKGEDVIDVPWVFPSARAESGHLMPGSLDKMWTTAKRKVEAIIAERRLTPLPSDLVLYSSRHTGLTNFCGGVGGDLARVARAAGHSDIRTTQKYLHPSVSADAEVMNRHNKEKARLAVVAKRA